MELSPKHYYWLVRPQWFSKLYMDKLTGSLLNDFDFKTKKVLDFGCGIGTNSWIFQPQNYIGIDCDSKRISWANKMYEDYNFIAVKKSSLPIDSNTMDYVFIMAVLHHMPSDLILLYLDEFTRVLKQNGKILVIEPCLSQEKPINNWFMKSLDKGKYLRNQEAYLELFSQKNYCTITVKQFKKCILYNEIFFTASKI